MELTYADGSTATICSDSHFRTSTGPYLYADYFIGEYYDARKEITGWNEPGYDDKSWHTALPDTQAFCEMTAQDNPPVRIIRSFAPQELLHMPNGELVLDVGENIAGFVSFQVTAPAGTTIMLQHAEVLDKDGNYFHNLYYVNNHQLVTYICKGEKDSNGNLIPESFIPNFSQQGFRYVKITGDYQFKKEDFISIPTDCPQRERAGWTGDTEVFSSTACFNQDTRLFYKKWMTDLRCD